MTRPFLSEAIATMLHDRQIDQLELTKNWVKDGIDIDLDKDGRAVYRNHLVSPTLVWGGEVFAPPLGSHGGLLNISYARFLDETKNPREAEGCYTDRNVFQLNNTWPFYSLRPGIDRVQTALNVGYFDEISYLWPWKFEMLYSYRWYCLQSGQKVRNQKWVDCKSECSYTYLYSPSFIFSKEGRFKGNIQINLYICIYILYIVI